MNRRLPVLAQCGLAALLGSVAISAIAADADHADWQIELPAGCTAKAQPVPVRWTYEAEDQQALKGDPRAILKPSFADMPAHMWRDLRSCFAGDDAFLSAQWRMLPVAAYTAVYSADHSPQPMVQAEFDQVGAWIASGRYAKGWTFLPFLDLGTAFVALPKRLQSADFDGVRVLVQFDNDNANLIRAGRALYVYQGFNADRSLFQLMIVPVQHAEFPSEASDAHLGFSLNEIDQSREQLAAYQKTLGRWLEARSDSMTPTLKTLDQMVLSVRATR